LAGRDELLKKILRASIGQLREAWIIQTPADAVGGSEPDIAAFFDALLAVACDQICQVVLEAPDIDQAVLRGGLAQVLRDGAETRAQLGQILDKLPIRRDETLLTMPAVETVAAASAAEEYESTPSEFRSDLTSLLARFGHRAQARRLPIYLPRTLDILTITQTRTVRLSRERNPDGSAVLRGWQDAVSTAQNLMVLGDAGLGKSWLIRTESHRLAISAMTSLSECRAASEVVIPIPVRCSEVVQVAGTELTERIVSYLLSEGLLPIRSAGPFKDHLGQCKVLLLMDGLDEVPTHVNSIRTLLADWLDTNPQARCILTSRFSGYPGPPGEDWLEVELTPFTSSDIRAFQESWTDNDRDEKRILDWIRRSGQGLSQNPLMLALLCALAIESTESETVPKSRWDILERVVRWLLTCPQRTVDRDSPARSHYEVDALFEILCPVAYSYATGQSTWVEQLSGSEIQKVIRTIGPAFDELHRPASEVLRLLSAEVGILVLDGDPHVEKHQHTAFPIALLLNSWSRIIY
jgi:hypothetical protein